MKNSLKIVFLFFLTFVEVFSQKNSAKLNLTITKVKSDNYINLSIDRYNKKLYKDISKFSSINKNLKDTLYITHTIKKLDKSYLKNYFPYKVVNIGDKTYLEIDYLRYKEPEKLYLWVIENKKVKKLYTGLIKDEFFNSNSPLSYINFTTEKKLEKQIVKIEKDYFIFKVGEITLKDSVEKNVTLSIPKNNKYFLKEHLKEHPITLFFKDYKSSATLNTFNKKVEIFGKYQLKNEKYLLNELYLTSSSPTDFLHLTSNGSTYPFQIKNYKINPRKPKYSYLEGNFIENNENTATLTIEYKHFLFSKVSKGLSSKNLVNNYGSISNTYLVSTPRFSYETYDKNNNIIVDNSITVNLNLSDNLTFTISKKKSKTKKLVITIFPYTFKEKIVFNFLDSPPKFTIEEIKSLDFKEILNSKNTTYLGEGLLKLTMNENDSIDNYTFNFTPKPETKIFLKNAEVIDSSKKIKVTNLKCQIKKVTVIDNKKIVNILTKGSILPFENKRIGEYIGFVNLQVIREEKKGGQF